MTNIVAEYINACLPSNLYGPNTLSTSSGLTRHNSLKSSRFQSCKTLPPSTPRLDRRNLYNDIGPSPTPLSLQRCDSAQASRTPRP
ncbi:unnamed protein product [Allacma fusca]|uniref:Uncharacterized protein n=1 Tax=Allacma fusca TaxID=39272 RepID=A0A8J2JN90_9HEXA|nr:unnamed protein product [Allacma fusca]